jgi:FixJ family two-component response regulator
MNPSVFIIDDDPHMRRAISRLVGSYGYNVKSFASAREFLGEEFPSGSACLILDLKMPDINGLDVQRVLAQGETNLPIIFVSGRADVISSVRAMKAGAVDFLTKPFDDKSLISAIEVALVRAQQAQEDRVGLKRDQDSFNTLTPRERDVCVRVARGLLNKQVGFELGTTEKTVKAQRARVMQKLGAESLADVVRLVERLRAAGAIAPSPSAPSPPPQLRADSAKD